MFTRRAWSLVSKLMFWQRRAVPAYPPPESLVRRPTLPLRVERQPDQSLHLHLPTHWQPTAIFGGPHPERIDPEQPLPFERRGETIRLPSDVAAPPLYLDVTLADNDTAPRRVTVAERILPFEAISNFRDVGGYPTADGRQVRWGRIFRAAGLFTLTAADRRLLAQLAPALIVDLRTDRELVEQPNQLPAALQPAYRHLPIYRRDQVLRGLRALIFNRSRLDSVVTVSYQRTIDEKAPVFGRILRLLAQADNLPAVIHCAVGKDRTGMTIALLLRLLGVPEEVVVADYSLSNLFYPAFMKAARQNIDRVSMLGVSVAELQPFLVAHPQTMVALLQHVNQKYGSVTGYAYQAAGLTPETVRRLQANLLE